MKNLFFILLYFFSGSTHAQSLSEIKQIWSTSGIPTIEEVAEVDEMKVWLIRLIVDEIGEADIYLENQKIVDASESDDFFIQMFLFTDSENNYQDHMLLDSGKLVHHIKAYGNELYAVERNGLFGGQNLEKVVKWNENQVKTDVFSFENDQWKISIKDYIYNEGDLTITGSFNGNQIAVYNDSLFNDYSDPIITNPAVERTGYIYKLNLNLQEVIFKSNFGTRQFADPIKLFEDDNGNYYCTGEYAYGDMYMQEQSINWEGFNSESDVFCFKINPIGDLSYLTGISTEGYILHEQAGWTSDGELTLALYSSSGNLVINEEITVQNDNNFDLFLLSLDDQGSYVWHSLAGSDARVTAIHHEEETLKIFGWNNLTSPTGSFPFTYNNEELATYEKYSGLIFEVNSSLGTLTDYWLADQEHSYEILDYTKFNVSEKVVVKFRQDFIVVDGYQEVKYTTKNQVNAIANFDSKLLSSTTVKDPTGIRISPTILAKNTIITIENENNLEGVDYVIYSNFGIMLAQGKVHNNQIQINNLYEDGLKYLVLMDDDLLFVKKLIYLNH